MKQLALLSGCLCLWLIGCGQSSTEIETSEAQVQARQLLQVPDHFGVPPFPEHNRPTQAKITLGQHLFYDTRLSVNETQSCESCHEQDKAFSDGAATPRGATGDQLVRNSQGLANAAYHASLTWASDSFLDLEDQLVVPIRSDNPIELGVNENNQAQILARFDSDPAYVQMFADAFPDSDSGATINKIIFSLASFLRTIITGNSPFDRFLVGDNDALTDQQKQGFALFNGEKFECFHCHSGINLTTSYRDQDTPLDRVQFPFFNNGLYNINGDGSYPIEDQGLFELSGDPADKGLFRPQSLRNVALTPPYMHDGSLATLREVVEHYARGGTLTESGPNAGDGRLSPLKSGLIRGFDASEEEIDALVAFLQSLSDDTLLTDPRFRNPFK